jgi:hypothetical protein
MAGSGALSSYVRWCSLTPERTGTPGVSGVSGVAGVSFAGGAGVAGVSGVPGVLGVPGPWEALQKVAGWEEAAQNQSDSAQLVLLQLFTTQPPLHAPQTPPAREKHLCTRPRTAGWHAVVK